MKSSTSIGKGSTGQRKREPLPGVAGSVRLIAGRWRGRRLPVLDAPGLRPSGDRLRETLFNWLQFDVPGSRCLDLFAGSGALGLEAASRGAGSVVLVEAAQAVHASLSTVVAELTDDAPLTVEVIRQQADDFLRDNIVPFDIAFIDPPFDAGLQDEVLQGLADPRHLTPGALVMVEAPRQAPPTIDLAAAAGYSVLRDKRIGDVRAMLLRWR